jgi:RHS repeat-associated protein
MPLPLDEDDRNRFLEYVGSATVLSEADFAAALAAAADPPAGTEPPPRFEPVEQAVRQRAAGMAGACNDPGTLGAIAAYTLGGEGERQRFADEVFFVARDPVFDAASGRVQLTQYDVVAVALSGTASWVGRSPVLAVDTSVVGEPGRCCGKDTVCVPSPPAGGSGGVGPLSVTDTVGVTTISPHAAQVRDDRGLPSIGLAIFEYPDPLGGGGTVPRSFLNYCTRVIADRGCMAKKPVCDWGDTGFTLGAGGGGDTGSGSSVCGPTAGGTVYGREVDKICTQIRSEENLPAACGGWCPECEGAHATKAELGAQRPIAGSGKPRYCLAAMPVPGGGSICEPVRPGQLELDNLRRQQLYGWTGPRSAGTRCSPTGREGIQVCITCEGQNGSCSESVTRPRYDPTVAAKPTGENRTGDSDVSSKHDFSAVRILVKPPPPPDPPPPPPPAPPAVTPSGPATSGPAPVGPKPDPPREPIYPEIRREEMAGGRTPRTNAADPVDLGSGALLLRHTDLSFPGPVRPLELTRRYSSRSAQRSGLGSNWWHNWDVRVQVLDDDNVPDFLSPWCGGLPGLPTAVMLHDGASGTELFVLDTTTRLYLPQAGGVATLRQTTEEGWALREPDGHIRTFNAEGYLVADRDRCGNGFTVEYEPTPLWELYENFCTPATLTAAGLTGGSRRCRLLSYLVGTGRRPAPDPASWEVSAADFPLNSVSDRALYARLAYAVSYLLHLQGPSGGRRVPESIDGARRLRPVRVTDGLGRQLRFRYATAALKPGQPGSRAALPEYDFDALPAAGLLSGVEGPGGAAVNYSYSRPGGYPAELNEAFLTDVVRQDTPGAAASVVPGDVRYLRFRYQWPVPRLGIWLRFRAPPSYDGWRAAVEQRYRAYFATFTGCWYREADLCGNGTRALGLLRLGRGDPADLTRQAANAYVSNVADNIISVENTGMVETEIRYPADPWAGDFDKVVAQRYGSSSTVQDPLRIPFDDPSDFWRTTLPKTVFRYAEAGPAPGGGDRTDVFLPAALRARFTLETPPTLPTPASPSHAAPATGTPGPSCDYVAMETERLSLPGWQEFVPYYDVPEAERHPQLIRPLRRTRLSRDQLLDAQVADPAHNDLVSAIVSGPPGSNYPVTRRILGRRAIVAANANRICSWVQQIDRDGDVIFRGLNALGQVLVEAVAEPGGQYVVTEMLVNADGSLVQQRRPTRTPTDWTPARGSTVLTYDEIDPSDNRGWNEWLPVFWSRRRNLIRAEERAGPGFVDEDEATGGFGNSVGRYATYLYEPLFNCLVDSISGSLESRPAAPGGPLTVVEVAHSRSTVVLDYQELSLKAAANDPASLAPCLAELEGWGFFWVRTASGEYDLPVVTSWQLPVELIGRDLNGDGVQGHRFATRPGQRAAGLPVGMVSSRPGSTRSRLTVLRWSPHGCPAMIEGPDGEREFFEYYSIAPGGTGPYGGDAAPAAAGTDGGYAGMLARQVRSRFFAAYPAEWGPPGQAPCPALRGPYQWLLPATTAPADVRPALAGLGLPDEQVDDILAATDPGLGEGRDEISYSYTITGHVRRAFTRTGEIACVTDIDGHVRSLTDRAGARRDVTYSALGLPLAVRRFDRNGLQTGESRRRYDAAGNLLTETVALEDGAFATPPSGRSISRSWTYTGEELPYQDTDAVGTTTTYRYDARKQVQGILAVAGGGAAGTTPERRAIAYTLDLDGNVTAVRYGAEDEAGPGLAVETRGYDSLGRVIRTVTVRGVEWQHAWSSRDLPTRTRRSAVPYGAAVPAPAAWETLTSYGDFGEVVENVVNGVTVDRATYTEGGRLLTDEAAGRGRSWMLQDVAGNPPHVRRPDGTAQVGTLGDGARRRITTTLRPGGAQTATSTIELLDPRGLSTGTVRVGGGVRIGESWDRDGSGDVAAVDDAVHPRIELRRNWAGWIEAVLEPRRQGQASLDETRIGYDGEGRITSVEDPAGALSTFVRDPFGAIQTHTYPGTPPVSETFSYDALGQIREHTVGTTTRTVIRDGRGDPVRIEFTTPANSGVLVERSYDELGRVESASCTNPGLVTLSQADRTVSTAYTYDGQGRISSETLSVGTSPESVVSSDWSRSGPGWQRQLRYPVGGALREWLEQYDGAGRLVAKTHIAGPASRRIEFNWGGELYAGRVHPQPNRPSPLREQILRGPLGSADQVRYTAIDTGPAGQPLNAAEGQQYCAGTWVTDVCAAPLLDLTIARDPAGRIGIRQTRWGNVRTAGGALVTTPRPVDWRGYAYTDRAHLDSAYEQETITAPALPSPYAATAASVAAAAAGATAWRYQRIAETEDLLAIADGTTSRWRSPSGWGVGHQLRDAIVDRQPGNLTYDDAGRVTGDGRRLYEWHPDGCLAAARNLGALERYGYTADGRLAAVWTGTGAAPTLTFLHDNLHPLTATGPSGPVWDAVWGPGLDRLVEWTDSAGGSGLQLALTDERGTVVGAWSPNTGLAGSITTTPEGRAAVRAPDGTVLCTEAGTGGVCPLPGGLPFGFSGTWRSPTTGLVWLRARWYDSRLGQFLSPDPAGAVDSTNPYAFAASDPINHSDPFGLGSAGPAGPPSTSGAARSPRGTGSGSGRAGPRPPWTFISSIVLAGTPGVGIPTPPQVPLPLPSGPPTQQVPPRSTPVFQRPWFPSTPQTGPTGSRAPTQTRLPIVGPGGAMDAVGDTIFQLELIYIEEWALRKREEALARYDDKLRQLMPHDDRGPIQAPSHPGHHPLLDPLPLASPVTDPDVPYPWVDPQRPDPFAFPGQPSALEWFLQKHHIATDKSDAEGWTKELLKLFLRAGIKPPAKKANGKAKPTDVMQIAENFVFVPSHRGRHDEEYHFFVYLSLISAIEGMPPGVARQEAFKNELDRLALETQMLPEILRRGFWKDLP